MSMRKTILGWISRSVVLICVASLVALSACSPSDQSVVNGAGASFPAPIYQSWFVEFNRQHPDQKINYQSVGSGAGVRQFIAETVDFGASDVAMSEDEIAQVKKGATLLPVTAGGIVVAYNLPGVEDLKLSRQVLIDIYMGKITQWNHPDITALNSNTKLPDTKISVLYRSDGSGTTAVFTKHLSAISTAWKEGPGNGKSISWPTGLGARGNEGVTALLQQTEGSIGYIEYGYAKQNGLSHASLENKSGEFVAYSKSSATKALESINLPNNLIAFDSDPGGQGSYPIVTYSWIMVYKKYDDPKTATTLRAVLKWVVTDGQNVSDEFGYIPLPENVVKRLLPVIDEIGK